MKKVCITIFVLFGIGCLSTFAQRTIKFAGIEWFVKDGFTGPGPNYWSDSSQNVWVDSNGFLHLKIRKVGSVWHCSEIYSKKEFGYGEYRFHVATNVENLPPNVVAGLFVYENDSSEIDIEFPNRNSQSGMGWYTVQPAPYNRTNHEQFALNLSGDYSTHKFIWSAESIVFKSYHGHASHLPSPGHLINEWVCQGDYIPMEGKHRLHINLWLSEGKVPGNQEETELIINWVNVPLPKKDEQDYLVNFEDSYPLEYLLKD